MAIAIFDSKRRTARLAMAMDAFITAAEITKQSTQG
jgi:hypothetical protein